MNTNIFIAVANVKAQVFTKMPETVLETAAALRKFLILKAPVSFDRGQLTSLQCACSFAQRLPERSPVYRTMTGFFRGSRGRPGGILKSRRGFRTSLSLDVS